jgi:phosphoglycerol geranylgeranyltransferase
MIGKVEKYLLDRIQQYDAIHISLIDPEKVTPQSASKIAREVESCKTAAIMIGGSTLTSTSHLDDVVEAIKKTVKIPVILFPNNITGICKHADAIWFMSLLNSSDPYFITGAQVLGAPIIKKFGLEVIPLGYIIVGESSAASVVGRACPIPYAKPELAVAHALAAQYFGMRFVYLEAGSGAKRPPANDMIKMVKDSIHVPLIVGGGMRTGEQVKEAVDAGADVIVTGTVIEEGGGVDKIRELVEYIKTDRKARDDRL